MRKNRVLDVVPGMWCEMPADLSICCLLRFSVAQVRITQCPLVPEQGRGPLCV